MRIFSVWKTVKCHGVLFIRRSFLAPANEITNDNFRNSHKVGISGHTQNVRIFCRFQQIII